MADRVRACGHQHGGECEEEVELPRNAKRLGLKGLKLRLQPWMDLPSLQSLAVAFCSLILSERHEAAVQCAKEWHGKVHRPLIVEGFSYQRG